MAKTKTAAEGGPKVKKVDAVRQALAAGVDNPTDAVAHIKKTFDLDITSQQFSTYKSVLKAKEGKTTGKKMAVRKPNAHAASKGQAINMLDLETVKALVQRMGADQVRQIAGLFE
jgi:hypothetical protein